MKKLVSALLVLTTLALVGVSGGGFRIKNDAQKEIYVALAVGGESPRIVKNISGAGFQMIEPGDSKSQELNIHEPTYIAIWESPLGLGGLKIVPVSTAGAGKVFNVPPKVLYTLKKGIPIEVVWKGTKLEPSRGMTKSDLQTISVIP